MAEEQVDDIPDVSLMGEDIQAPTDEPSDTPADKATDDGADTQEDTKDTDESTSEGKQEPSEQQTPETETEAAAQKARNEQYARQRIQERQRTRQNVERQIEENYGAKSEQDLIDEGMTEQQAQIEALRQEMQFERQKAHIAELNAGMQAEAVNVTNDFSVFNPSSKDYDPEFAQMVEAQYKTAARLQTDDNGIVINAEVPLYDYYKQMHDIYNRGTSRGQQQGQQEYQQMMARTENPGGSSSTSSGNSLSDLEERLGDVVIT